MTIRIHNLDMVAHRLSCMISQLYGRGEHMSGRLDQLLDIGIILVPMVDWDVRMVHNIPPIIRRSTSGIVITGRH